MFHLNVLILNGSPKRKGGASHFFVSLFRFMLCGCKIKTGSLHGENDYSEILAQFSSLDALVLSVPLYVDGIPSHVQKFLEQAETFCIERNCHFTLYVISNNGFIEGRQNQTHLKMYQCWCEHAGIKWGGGIGIGGGVMLHVLSIVYPIILTLYLVSILLNLVCGNCVTSDMWIALFKNVLVYLFLNCGALYCMVRLAWEVRNRKAAPNRYTRVMIPSFLFIPCADIFMALLSLCNGRFIFTLLKKDNDTSTIDRV